MQSTRHPPAGLQQARWAARSAWEVTICRLCVQAHCHLDFHKSTKSRPCLSALALECSKVLVLIVSAGPAVLD